MFESCPEVLKDVATQLYEASRMSLALQYFEIYRELGRHASEVDADSLVLQGQCFLALGDTSAAEECFLAAIEGDDQNIEGRVELAAMYETAHENEQAFVLVNEVMSLEAERTNQPGQGPLVPGASQPLLVPKKLPLLLPRPGQAVYSTANIIAKSERVRRALAPPRRRVRRLGGETKRQAFENELTKRMKEKFDCCQELKARVQQGDPEAQAQWMDAAKELTDDFRSFREYYPWDKYLRFLGYSQEHSSIPSTNSTVAAMAERLHQSKSPPYDPRFLPMTPASSL